MEPEEPSLSDINSNLRTRSEAGYVFSAYNPKMVMQVLEGILILEGDTIKRSADKNR